MEQELNCRGQACPAPVMQVRDFLAAEHPDTITVIVDNEAAKENVSRFLAHHGFQVRVEEQDGDWQVRGIRDDAACEIMDDAALAEVAGPGQKIMVLIGSDRMGHGDDSLGAGLLINFLKTLKEMGPDLWRLVFVNNGVKLTAAGSEAVPILEELAATGVSILVCGTCLNHFHLLEKKAVGKTTNMLDIVTSMQVADSVINI